MSSHNSWFANMQTYVKFLDDATRTMNGYSNPDVKRPDYVGADNLEDVLEFVQTVKNRSAAVSHVSYLSSEPVTNTFSHSITKNGDGFTLTIFYGGNFGLSETFDTEELAKESIQKLTNRLFVQRNGQRLIGYWNTNGHPRLYAWKMNTNRHDPSFARMETL